jgi:hypothetical protein
MAFALAIIPAAAEEKNILSTNDQDLSKSWEWVRYNKGCYGFHDGMFRIKSLPGNIYEREGIPSQNILLMDFPHEYACVTLKVSLTPDKQGEQAGLLFYRDDDHYMKINPLSPLSDPFKGALKRPTQKANS